MNPGIFQQPFFAVALPIMVTILIAAWNQNKRIEDINFSLNKRIDDLALAMNRRFDEIVQRLTRMEAKLDNHEERLVRLEERTSPFGKATR